VEWLGDVSCNVCFEDKHTAARALWNLSNEIPTPVPDSILNGTQDGVSNNGDGGKDEIPDLGNMTWRFGKRPIRKVANDRYGRRGTTARILMRVATSEDTLVERPNSWPAPPGGFSSTSVLGPESDYAPKKGQKGKQAQKHKQQQQKQQQRRGSKSKKKRQRGGNGDDRQKGRENNTESLMDRGLSSGRAGFSVEELEKERARKKQKVNES